MLPTTPTAPTWGNQAYPRDFGKRVSTYQRRRHIKLACAGAGLFLLLCWAFIPHFSGVLLSLGGYRRPPSSLQLDLSHLANIDLTHKFTYSRRLIRVKKDRKARWKSLTQVNETLYQASQVQTLDASNLTNVVVSASPPITITVPWPEKHTRFTAKDSTASISIGVATSLRRLSESIDHWSHWLPNTGAYLHVLVPPDTHENTTVSEERLKELGIDANVTTSKLPYPHAYFSLLKHLYENRRKETRWIAVFDDDTFVPSLQDLVSHLNRNYDASSQKLVGALSDNTVQINTWGIITYGGGGIFISLPLAAYLTSPKVFDACMESGAGQGDRILTDCLYDWSEVRPIFDSSLHQMDVKGDPSGYFESGRKLLTIHHWKSPDNFFSVDMPRVAQITKACGAECMLMRFQFADGVVLSNGYSIAMYGENVTRINFDAVEMTWGGDRSQFIHHIGPLRNVVALEEKRSLRMIATSVIDGVGILQTYSDRDSEHDTPGSFVHEVLELMWLFD
ncbi:hypothetical protein PVAG01_02322 [Phlyctema vagabunda]|uniref:Glycosyltransferase family 31 protein n=1 Tax=Phlyctema vagabunda TaxID=108571 RepID=A0ABR4PQG8_9HELO